MLDRFASEKFTLILSAVLAIIFMAVGTVIGLNVAANTTPVASEQVTIVEKTTRMATGGYAVGEVNGEQVLVYGDWVAGDVVTAFPEYVDGSVKPRYNTTDPNTPSWLIVALGTLTGFIAAVVFFVVSIFLGEHAAKVKKAREDAARATSDRIIHAAIG